MEPDRFRTYHIIALLNAYTQETLPLDLLMHQYFRNNKAIGSKDRAVIADTLYGMVRWKGLLDHLCIKPATWEQKLQRYRAIECARYASDPSLPQHVRLSFPKQLFECLVESHGIEKAASLCLISNSPAPTTVRVNLMKTTREEMLALWGPQYSITPCLHSDTGITFLKKINFFTLPEFQEGKFEIQDEGSQLIGQLVKPLPGQQVLDYCAGSGGKTLAFAPRMEGKGQIFLHDIRPNVLIEAKRRLRRAGIQNAQVISPAEESKLKRQKKQMDWVLVDAPCTGTGTMRRNPDMKWRFTSEMVKRLAGQQRMIFEQALSYLKPDGRIVYATCSILAEENQRQVEHFIQTYGLSFEGDPLQILPSSGGMDGFYGAVLKKNSH